MRFAVPLFGIAVLLAACGGKVVVDGAGNAGGALDAGGSGIACSDAGAQDIPAVERHCAKDADCMIEVVVDCCAIYPVGVASSQLGAYDAYQNACSHAPNPPCECPANVAMTVTEDGKSTQGNVADQAQVACQNGQCSTFMP